LLVDVRSDIKHSKRKTDLGFRPTPRRASIVKEIPAVLKDVCVKTMSYIWRTRLFSAELPVDAGRFKSGCSL
jgi:hypothetical protein